MDERLQNLKGSPSRDLCKQMHKLHCSQDHYACDIDLMWVTKEFPPGIVAALDFKTQFDEITFPENIAYVDLVNMGIPVYIVTGDGETGVFKIEQFLGGDSKKPTNILEPVCFTNNWKEFREWQEIVRLENRPIRLVRRESQPLMLARLYEDQQS